MRKYQDSFVPPGYTGETTRLCVNAPSLSGAQAAVEVRDDELRLLGLTKTGTTARVPAGRYTVRVVVPDGQAHVSVVEAAPNRDAIVSAVWKRKTHAAAKGRSLVRAQKGSVSETFRGAAPFMRGAGPRTLDLRVLTFDNGAWRRTDQGVQLTTEEESSSDSATLLSLRVVAQDVGLFFLEVYREAGSPVTVALPVVAQTGGNECRVTVAKRPGSFEVAVALADYLTADVMLEYLESGALAEASDLVQDAEEMLQQKMADPVEAALGGYVLLRVGDLERLHQWPENLADWFPSLPDGAVIAGELAARRKHHDTALGFLVQAVDRGLPVFSEGLSVLTSRLRHYALRGGKLLGDDQAIDRAQQALARVQPYSGAVDYSSQVLTLRGMRVASDL